ncbi:branched-chain amino acid ABC transporter permease [Carbonactinospora thermoautotrophica]|uniref:Branched-chain amino acid ABC transporter permease n=1 Tax=Carbonactinospora thermoautotrophica TaxID=1469144 RepID=A0A132NCE8_9ACTN|nr:branched-chain amino acid ABC transporter permease [Carbonactinospora thermoautotrophica]KWX05499.1 hypothetical protein TH66_02130 [Carbonactinospora thermoautotrophica]KWX07839.1 hypothetical protein TR74_17425 [Carbonactinospora thermoautotrophica]MCX9192399.1 branched-chain amino acid ABC transporter permease [Carbonactinospora thermoautotrophica]
MQLWVQALFTGLTVGVVYGVIGVGYVVIHRITGMVNFAQGDLAMIGAFGAVVAAGVLPVPLAVLIGGLVGAVAALLLHRLVVHPLRDHGLLVQTIATLGAAIGLRSLAQLIFGTEPYAFAPFTEGEPLRILGGSLQLQAIWLVAITAALYIVLYLFFDRTMTGKALSACAVNRYAAGVVGISVTSMAMVAFAISGAISGIAAAAQVPIAFATVGSGLALGLKGFIAAILGGFDRLGLTLVGGVLIGFVEAWSAAAISTSYQDVIVLSLLLVLLVARPSGLTRMKVSERV